MQIGYKSAVIFVIFAVKLHSFPKKQELKSNTINKVYDNYYKTLAFFYNEWYSSTCVQTQNISKKHLEELTMKKLFAVLLTLVLVVGAFAACGGNEETTAADETTTVAADETTEAVADETTEAAADETTEAAADETTEAVADETTEAVADETTEAAA